MMPKGAPPPPPPSPPPDDASAKAAVGPRERSKNQGPAFGKRLMILRKEHPDVEVPSDLFTYSLEDLEAYFASKVAEKGGTPTPPPTPQSNADGGVPEPQPPVASPDQDRKSPKSTRKRKAVAPPPDEDMQYSNEEALEIQQELIEGFSSPSFKDELKALNDQFPDRKKKGRKDMPLYFDAFEALVLSVFAAVLPRHHLQADWDGVREMNKRMEDALRHQKVKKTQEEINVLMGLPRDAVFQPPKKEEDLIIEMPNGDGPVTSHLRPTVMDEDGDEAHEFFVEDMETGELRIRGPTALEETDCWYVVLHTPSIMLRSKPDVKADMVGRKKNGKRVRIQRVVDNKWAKLHPAELARLGVREAWAPLIGSECGLSGQLMERA
jgi:hypothetical protein